MKCPNCGTNAADDAAVCQKCDHILDPSLFSADAPPANRKPSKPKPAKRPVGKTPGAGSKQSPKRASSDAPARKSRPEPEEEQAPEEDWRAASRAATAAADEEAAASAAAERRPQSMDADQAMADAKNFVSALSTSDKVAFWGGVGTLICCFFPWQETVEEGETIGLLGLGALVFFSQVLVILAIIVRTQKLMPNVQALVPWLLQFSGSAFSIVWCLVLIKLAVNTTKARAPYGNEEVWTSKPGLGAILAVVTGIVVLTGTLMGLREKSDR